MPAYDDIASLYFSDGEWKLHYTSPGTPSAATIDPAEDRPFSKEAVRDVLDEMKRHAASTN
jgi:hypothetical protein